MECLLRRFVALENHRSNDNCMVRSCLASVNRYWTYVHFAVTCYVGQPLAKSVSYPIYIWWIRFDLWGCVIFLKRLMPFYMDYWIDKRFLSFWIWCCYFVRYEHTRRMPRETFSAQSNWQIGTKPNQTNNKCICSDVEIIMYLNLSSFLDPLSAGGLPMSLLDRQL